MFAFKILNKWRGQGTIMATKGGSRCGLCARALKGASKRVLRGTLYPVQGITRRYKKYK